MADISSVLGSAGLGGAIGKAIVQLELDSKKYVAEMNAAKAETTASANSMSSGVSKFAGLAKTAFLGAGVAVAAFAAYSVKAAIEANAAHLKLTNTFENNRRLADSSVAAFEHQADALRDLTGVDDEAIISAQALLGQFKLTGGQVQQLIPLIVDLSEKMGIDLEAAAKAVGKATQGSSGALSRYGIILDKNKLAADGFGTTLKGLGVVAGFAADQADNEPWRVLGAKFEEIAEDVGQALLPALQNLAESLTDLLPILKPVITLLGEMIGYIGDLAAALTLNESGFVAYSGKLQALAQDLADNKISILEYEQGLIALRDQYGFTFAAADGYDQALTEAAQLHEANAGRAELHARMLEGLAAASDQVTASLRDQLDAMTALADPAFALIHAAEENRDAEHELADARRDLNELTRRGKEGTDAYREAHQRYKDAVLGAAESQSRLVASARNLQQSVKDGETNIKAAKDAIRDMGKAAGLTGGEIKALVGIVKKGLADARATAERDAPGVGKALTQGIADAIDQYAPSIYNSITSTINNAITAARIAAQAESPSRKMFELGIDLMTGLQNGITDHEQEVIDAAQRVIDKAIKEMEKQAEALQSRLDKIISKADAMRSAVQGGFSSFLDISGAFAEGQDIGAFFQAQLAGAQEFAKVLKQLQKAGASSALLQQIASAGPEAMPFAQQLLASGTTGSISDAYQQIADLAGKTADQLSNAYFGEKIDALQSELKGIREELRTLNQPRRLEIAFRPGADNALRHLIIQIIGEIGLSKAPL